MQKLQAFLRLLCVWALLLTTQLASANAPVHPETRVGAFEVAAEACVRLSVLATSSGHQEKLDASTAEAVGYPHATNRATTALAPYYPAANGFLGKTTQQVLQVGQRIDRYGGSRFSRFFSPAGTPQAARALPPGTAGQALRTFEVVKPLSVEAGTVAPAFGQLGMGTQYRAGMTLGEMLKQGFIKEIF